MSLRLVLVPGVQNGARVLVNGYASSSDAAANRTVGAAFNSNRVGVIAGVAHSGRLQA